MTRPEPAPYQIVGRDFLASHRHALLADEMRVRKTRQAIMAAHKIGAQSVLVACPAIAVSHWHREFEKWWPDGPLPRLAVWSYDKARAQWQSGLKGAVDVFIPDEAHFARNPDAARTRMVYGKTGFSRLAGCTWALSGTPAPKHAAELWPMMRAFGVTGLTYWEFVKRYCRTDATFKPVGTKTSMIPELRGLLAMFMLRRTRKDVAPDMPEIAFDFLPCDIGAPDIAEAFVDDDALLAYAEHMDTEDRIAVAKAKAGVLAKEVEFAVGNGLLKQTVIFGWHKEPLFQLQADLAGAGIKVAVITGDTSSTMRDVIQTEFREGHIQVVVANIISAGTAIDLSAASHGYFLELWWVSADNIQAANRLISLDKHGPVTFDVCTAEGTIDQHVQEVLARRTKEIRAMGLA